MTPTKEVSREKDLHGNVIATPAAAGPLPRIIKQNERAVEGTKRFKVFATNYLPQPTRYILSRAGKDAEKDAREFYLKSTGLTAHVEGLKAAGVEKPETPLVYVKELPD